MKILFCGYHNPNFTALPEYIENAIKQCGHDLLVFDWRKFIIPGRLREKIKFLNNIDINRLNRRLVDCAKRSNPDVLLVNSGLTIEPHTIKRIKMDTGAITINWFSDYPLNFDRYLELSPSYDYIFTSSTDCMSRLISNGIDNVRWVPFACDPVYHKPLELDTGEMDALKCDIAFVGSMYQERIDLLETISDLNLGIWGPGWEMLDSGSSLKRHVKGRSVKPEQWVKIYNACKIGLNYVGRGNQDIAEEDMYMANTKVFEILACGTFQVVDAKKDILTLFTPGKDLVCYKNRDELPRIVKNYLSSRANRISGIARQGREKVLKQHTYVHRINTILENVLEPVQDL